MSSSLGPTSRLLQYLPAVYQEPALNQPPDGEGPKPVLSLAEAIKPEYQAPYLQSYLLPYEEILLGLPGGESLLAGAGGDLLHLHDAERLYPQPGTESPYATPGAGDLPLQSGAEGLHGLPAAENRYGQPGAEYPPGPSGAGDVLARADSKSGLGLESIIAHLHRLFDPWKTPEEFLPWLAQWAALTLATGLPDRIRRKLLAEIIPLYRIRGTKHYLEQLLAIYRVPADVIDDLPALQVGRHSTVGRDSWIGGGPPHFFRVVLRFSRAGGPELERQRRLAKYVIELAKPAHTDYALEVTAPRFQLGVHSTVAVDTFL